MRIAVVGASTDRRKYGNKAVRALLAQGHDVAAINPGRAAAGESIEGVPAHASLRDVPGAIDVATFYVPPAVGERLLGDIVAREIPQIWLNPGAESDALLDRARDLGIETRLQCSILAVGDSPANYR